MAASILPDPKAQEIAGAVSRNEDALRELVDSIPQTTVNGPETRQELLEANDHIVQAIAWLQRTADREVPRYERLEQALTDNERELTELLQDPATTASERAVIREVLGRLPDNVVPFQRSR